MKTKVTEQIEDHFQRILEINYDNKNGGAYAYVQFLAYTREVLVLLQPVRELEKQIAAIESINWVFNEYLGSRFTEHQRLIFEARRREIKSIFDSIRTSLSCLEMSQKL
jgi:hypothetical protein